MNHAADQQLIEAVRGGDEVAVAQALAAGADPDAAVSLIAHGALPDNPRPGRAS